MFICTEQWNCLKFLIRLRNLKTKFIFSIFIIMIKYVVQDIFATYKLHNNSNNNNYTSLQRK